MPPLLNIDIKELICQAEHTRASQAKALTGPRSWSWQFSTLCHTLASVDREWRLVAQKYAWHTVYVDDSPTPDTLAEIRTSYGRYTRKLCIQIKFKGIASHYRRYSQSLDSADFQPFSDLSLWPRLRELEIVYAHKCAFPGLAKYLEPRLGSICVLTIKGRVPIDMRRNAMFLKSSSLLEVNVRSLPRADDSVSTISHHNDPILTYRVAESITSISLSTLIDVRIIRSVLASTRLQLHRLELIGLRPAQLAAVGLSRLDQDIQHPAFRRSPWTSLVSLSIKLCTHLEDSVVARINLDAGEFPRLAHLAITDCSPSIAATEHPLRFSYEQTFSREWPNLRCLRALALGDRDACLLSQCAPRLSIIRIQSVRIIEGRSLASACGLWHLLLSPQPLTSVTFSCITESATATLDDEDGISITFDGTLADFACLRQNHPIRALNAPHIKLTQAQESAIRQKCQHLAQLSINSDKPPANSASSDWQQDGTRLFSATFRGLAQIASLWAAS
ncbi:hypothetical protein GGI18_000787 [Coemansia linderi]|uniref:Uncharacterized protein n=1 Tax=Coemansia linderi TaxID=2663919 RepID=A0ACC1KMD3_9FUNG|nr:hypothetical protein GGI18_000787 [Coemansia linderi]